MGVPEEIRKVKRPCNSVVVDSGSKFIYRYAVIKRIGCKVVNGMNQPVSGGTIGHIVDGKFVELDKYKVQDRRIEYKDFADVKLIHNLSSSLLDEALEVYEARDAFTIYTIAILKVIYPGIPFDRIASKYNLNWISELFPGLALSKNTLSKFVQDLGKSYALISTFMRNRVSKIIKEHHIAIDGTLKTDNSEVNTLSHYSRKARIKGTKDISILFAYDIETKEPICSKVYSGNIIDSRAYEDFLKEYDVKQGILMGDKGFPKKQAEKIYNENPNLCWLNPIKRSDKRIKGHSMYKFTGMIDNKDKDLLYKKEKVSKYYLYSFYDRRRAIKEEADYFKHNKGKEYNNDDRDKKDERFGTVVFESNLDEDPKLIYKLYEERWLIEECFRYYKHALDLTDTRVHSNYSVIGQELINFFASNMTMKLVKKFDEAGLSKKMSYKDIMAELASAKKARASEDGEWLFVRTTKHTDGTLQALGLLPKPEPEPVKKKGRPFKIIDPNAPVIPKRKQGRPKKQVDPNAPVEPKRKRGRPKKQVDPNALVEPKRKRGRPKKQVDPNAPVEPKLKRGRPKKQKVKIDLNPYESKNRYTNKC
jgi:hypothetical protein